MSNGVASKIIVPTDAVNLTKSNVLFSETTGLGNVTNPAEKPKEEVKDDVCCDEPVVANTKTANTNRYNRK